MTGQDSPVKVSEWPGGWFIVKRSIVDFFTNIVPWLVGTLAFAPLLVVAILQLILHSQNAGSNLVINLVSALLGIVSVVAILWVTVCWVGATPVYGLARADGKKMSIKEVYTIRGDILWRLVGTGILLGLAVLLGFILFIIPGIILLIWLLPTIVLVPYVVVEEKLGAIDSIKRAHKLREGHASKVWGIVGWYMLLSLIILIPIGLIILAIVSRNSHPVASTQGGSSNSSSGGGGGFGGGPLSAISFAYLYRWIKQQNNPDTPALTS